MTQSGGTAAKTGFLIEGSEACFVHRVGLDDEPTTVKLTLLSDDSIRVEPVPGPMVIEAISAEQSYSPFHMMAGALAYCTLSVMHSWATKAKVDTSDLTLEVAWTFAEKPHRVGTYDIHFEWPSLPEERLAAAKRVAELCTVHATFRHPPEITIDGHAGGPPTDEHSQADGAEDPAPELGPAHSV